MTWDDALGLEVTEITPTRVTGTLEVGERHHQPFGLVHGGVWASVVEVLGSVGGTAALRVTEPDGVVVGVHNSTHFVRPMSAGRVDAVGVPIHVGRSQQLWRVDITRAEDGKLVAHGELRVQRIDP